MAAEGATVSGWRHPKLGPIEPIPPKRRPRKVWKHFYNAAERWDRLCEHHVAGMCEETEGIVGVRRAGREELPRMDEARWRRARSILQSHHDAAYAPVYRAEMASPGTIWTPRMDADSKHYALTPKSIFLVVQLERSNWVVTAYRPTPPARTIEWSEADLRRHGESYFRRKTGMDIDSLVRLTAENLRRASSAVPHSVRELWWLASAVGYGRLLADHPEVREPLAAGESALRAVREELQHELVKALDWDGCLGRLATGLEDDRTESLEDALAASEELLAVADALGAEVQGNAFCAEAARLLASLPAEWSHVSEHARAMRRVFGAKDSLVLRLWTAVDDATLETAVREGESLVPTKPRWEQWSERIAALAGDASSVLGQWVRACLDGITVAQPAPVMGGGQDEGEPWEVRGRPMYGAQSYRMFVVDGDHPRGYEVTQHFTTSDGTLWQIEHDDDRAMVILIAGERPIPGDGLDEVLTVAADRDDVVLAAREISPPR
jgi:hypothetical protein